MIMQGIRRRRLHYFIFLLAIVPSISGMAQGNELHDPINFGPEQKKALDDYFDTLYAHHQYLGGVALAQDGRLIYVNNQGFLAEDSKRKADAGTRYRIGSISKMYTAAIIYELASRKKLNLNNRLSKYFPNIKNASKISLLDLLGHQSGIPNITDDDDYDPYKDYSDEEIISRLASYDSDFKPGSQQEYSNSNYILLTYIAEQASEKPFAKLLNQLALNPAKVANTVYEKDIVTNHNDAHSFTLDLESKNWDQVKPYSTSLPKGSGMIASTPKDVSKFVYALFSGLVIDQKYVDKMKPEKASLGFGAMAFPYHEDTFYGHAGKIESFNSLVGYCPRNGISFAVLSNGSQMNLNDININLLNVAYGRPIIEPQIIEDEQFESSEYAGVYENEALGLSLQITKIQGQLYGQATGQQRFPLNKTKEANQFSYPLANIVIDFLPNANGTFDQLKLLQNNEEHLFNRN